jgi:hypothetical protein
LLTFAIFSFACPLLIGPFLLIDHFIPVSRNELISALSKDLAPESAALLLEFFSLYNAILHFRFHQISEKINSGYLPYAPDNDMIFKASPSE